MLVPTTLPRLRRIHQFLRTDWLASRLLNVPRLPSSRIMCLETSVRASFWLKAQQLISNRTKSILTSKRMWPSAERVHPTLSSITTIYIRVVRRASSVLNVALHGSRETEYTTATTVLYCSIARRTFRRTTLMRINEQESLYQDAVSLRLRRIAYMATPQVELSFAITRLLWLSTIR